MTRKKPEHPEEQWDSLLLFADDAGEEALFAMTEAEVDAALRERGHDLAQLEARGKELIANLTRPAGLVAVAHEAVPAETPELAAEAGNRVLRWVLLAAALLLVTAFLGPVVLATLLRPELPVPVSDKPGPVPEKPSRENALVAAEAHRRDAEAACANKDWQLCRKELDQARELDPKGDEEAKVQGERALIAAALVAQPDKEKPKPPDKGPK